MSFELWRLAKRGKESLGLSCTEDGLFFGQTPLLDRTDGIFAPRSQGELARLLSQAHDAPVSVRDRMPGLASVAKALNRGDLCLARIAAVHLRLPDLPSPVAKLAIEFQDLIIDLERKDSPLLRRARLRKDDWDPGKHPRLGGPPNPGWFAPTDGGDSADERNKHRVTLAPTAPNTRIDELEDLAEWIANAKPEEEATIRGEIKRQFYDVGDKRGGEALNRALSDALVFGIDDRERQEILDSIDAYTQADPREMAMIEQGLAIAPLLRLPTEVPGSPLPEEAPAQPKAEPAVSPNEEIWRLGWAARGRAIEEARGANLGPSFPVVDKFVDGTVTSIKSVDLNGATYQNTGILVSRVNKYADQLDEFNGDQLGKDRIESKDINEKVLEVVVPRGSMTSEQWSAIESVRQRMRNTGIRIDVIEF